MFCARPFAQFYVVENGDVHLCCPDWIAMPAGNLFATPPLEIWTGKVATRIRYSMLDQSFRFCTGCPLLPGPSGCVVNENHTELLPIERIDMLTMAYDATCNLSCPSCRLAVRGKGPKSAAIQEILLSSGIFKHVNNFVTSGNGDPLASPLFWELVKALPGLDCPDLKLTLQTNGNLLTPKTWERLGDESRRVSEISVSVDAARKETYKLNHRGGDWDLLMANLEVIKRRGVMLQMNFVVQANNYKEMLEFMGMADAFGAYRVFFSGIENWGMFTDDEYVARAVHKPGHPEHEQLLETLRDPKLQGSFRIIVARLPKP